VPGPAAAVAAELDGAGVRRLTRRSAAQRAVTTWGARLTEAWSTVVSVGVALAVSGGWLASVRQDIAGRAPGGGTALPASVTTLAAAIVAVAGLTTLLDRLGPVSASPAAAAWWLPLPAERAGLLRSDLVRVAGVCAGTTTLVCTPLAMVWSEAPSLSGVAATVLGGAAAASVLVGAVALLQTRDRRGGLAPMTGAVAVTAAAVAAGSAVSPWAADALAGLTRNGLPAIGPPAALGLAAVATLLLIAADRGLGRLGAGSLRAHGTASAFASASVFSLDTRDLGRALAATDGFDRLPAATAIGLLLGWLAAAVAVGHPARFAHASPALDRLLPLSTGQVVTARCVAPALVLTVVCGLSGLLVGLGSPSPLAWAALALATVPAWTAAALRGAYRPDLDWSGPVVATPMGVFPAGIGATLVQGIDVGLVGAVPIVAVVLVGADPSPIVIGVQFAWALGLAAGALTYLARRRST
jgi:hypothetical protein